MTLLAITFIVYPTPTFTPSDSTLVTMTRPRTKLSITFVVVLTGMLFQSQALLNISVLMSKQSILSSYTTFTTLLVIDMDISFSVTRPKRFFTLLSSLVFTNL